jgi:F0F1-type ATP synthase delta subunit
MLVSRSRTFLGLHQARFYAQDSKGKKAAVKAPVSVRGTAGRFAMRFFEEAYEREGDAGVVRLEKELAILDWSVRGQTSWKVQTTSPFFDLQWRREQITKRLSGQGLSPLLIDLVMDLVAQGEVRRLQQVRTDFDEIMRAFRREVDVTLTTAASLSTEHVDLIKRSVQTDYLKPDDNLIFAHVVDESLVGGFKVYIRGQEHDHSWVATVRTSEEENSRAVNAPLEALSKAPRAASVNSAEAVKIVLSDKETQGWLSSDLFARSQAQEDNRVQKGEVNRNQVLQAIKAIRSKSPSA